MTVKSRDERDGRDGRRRDEGQRQVLRAVFWVVGTAEKQVKGER